MVDIRIAEYETAKRMVCVVVEHVEPPDQTGERYAPGDRSGLTRRGRARLSQSTIP